MSVGQIILYTIIALAIFSYLRKFINYKRIRQHNAAEIIKRLKLNNVLLLDVRTEPERKKGCIKGSVHIPLHQLKRRQDELNKFKNKEIVCYCRSGNRSLNAAVFLKKQGFTVSNLRGGIVSWNNLNQR